LLEDAEENGWAQPQKSNLERILKNGQHLLSLINDVLDLVKIEAGRMEINFSPVDVREIITWVVEETSSLAAEKKLDVSVAIEDEVITIESNPVKLRQVLLNLVSNALKYTERGKVTISAARVGENQLALRVQDTGVGIPEEMQERIFEAFYQVDGGYTRKAGGTGLGLAIVSQLTGLLGGEVELKSVPGQGSTFTVLLPVRQSEQHSMILCAGWGGDTGLSVDAAATTATIFGEGVEPGTEIAPAQEQRDLVLVVDDDPDVIALLRTSLQDSDYAVIGVQDPVRLIELVQKMRPSAIMLDVLMPDRNGWQILRQLKSHPATSSIPVIMLTVLSEPETGYRLGADDYLIKPFQKDALLKTLQSLVAGRRTSSRRGKPGDAERTEMIRVRRSHHRK
jgi:CheY-like chemotaxis protein/two-component sensor histidine kinase